MHVQPVEHSHSFQAPSIENSQSEEINNKEPAYQQDIESQLRNQLLRSIYAESDCV